MNISSVLRAFWKNLLLLAIIATIVVFLIQIVLPNNDFFQTANLVGVCITALAGLLGGWGYFDRKVTHKNRLINQVRNQVSDVAKSAISQLNDEGYLADGSLRGANFSGAKLAGVDLKATDKKGLPIAANLEKVNLYNADLSGADLRGINLKGANLELTNFANALLTDADLSNTKCHLTILIGTKLNNTKFTGAKFAGETCDTSTFLPDGKIWNENRSWTEFGATEILLNYPGIKIDPLDEAKRTADLRLLNELWQYISSMHTNNVIQMVYHRTLAEKYFNETFAKYLHLREEYPEKHFINVELEGSFVKFDRILVKFCKQLVIEETTEFIGGENIFLPAYKRPEVLGRHQTDEVFQRNMKENDKTNEYGQEVLRQHAKLVKTIKMIMPDFSFSETSSV